MRVGIITLFPEFFQGPLQTAILGRAVREGVLEVHCRDLRPHGEGRHHTTDDYPFGGGAGMVMKPGPVVEAIELARTEMPGCRVVLLTPQGRPFDQQMAGDMARGGTDLVLVCGRYEGYDERIRRYCDEEISIGDFVLMGGETAALALIEAVARWVPGVLGDAESAVQESLTTGLLEYPQYTRPRVFRGEEVPEVLLSGNHGAIAEWRKRQSLLRTARRRPDLLLRAELTGEEEVWVRSELAGEDTD